MKGSRVYSLIPLPKRQKKPLLPGVRDVFSGKAHTVFFPLCSKNHYTAALCPIAFAVTVLKVNI
jgi:hypothetical protein